MQLSSSFHVASDRPSPWVSRFAPLIPVGEVLDLACGSGRHARLLASLNHSVLAVDRDPVALEHAFGAGIVTQQLDLEQAGGEWPFAAGRFSGVVVTNYLYRPLFPHILRSLAEGGVLIYETFAVGNEQFGKPSNPSFLLRRAELIDVVKKEPDLCLHILAYEDGYVDMPKAAVMQRICVINALGKDEPSQLPN